MKLRITLAVALAAVAMALTSCCPGDMLQGGGMPQMDHHAQVAAAQPVDSDGDGVVDSADRCPGTPRGVVVDAFGCPVDSDGDGVPNGIDRCPDTPRGVAVDAAGCPLDSDGDGVPDYLDKCPNTPRGVNVNRDGCSVAQLAPPPPAPSRVEQELATKGEIKLENVYFETNSAKLTPESSGALDEAGAALAKYPMLKVEVGGHTDKRGSAAYNKRLSQARAESVRAYLINHFKLAPAQLTAKGYGSSQAETAGNTPEELARDRRVVLKVLNPEALPKNVEVKQ